MLVLIINLADQTINNSPSPVALLRRLARATHGPWVVTDELPKLKDILSASVPTDILENCRIISAQIAYAPRVYREPRREERRHCTHRISLTIDNNALRNLRSEHLESLPIKYSPIPIDLLTLKPINVSTYQDINLLTY